MYQVYRYAGMQVCRYTGIQVYSIVMLSKYHQQMKSSVSVRLNILG